MRWYRRRYYLQRLKVRRWARELAADVAYWRQTLWPPGRQHVAYAITYLYDVLPLLYVAALVMTLEGEFGLAASFALVGLALSAVRPGIRRLNL